MREARAQGGALALIALVADELDVLEALDDGSGVVLRAVVDDDDLERVRQLPQALDDHLDRAGLVIGGHDDRQLRGPPPPPPPASPPETKACPQSTPAGGPGEPPS